MLSWITLTMTTLTVCWAAIAAAILWNKARMTKHIRTVLPPGTTMTAEPHPWRRLALLARMADEQTGSGRWVTLAASLEVQWNKARTSILVAAGVTAACFAVDLILSAASTPWYP